MVPKLLDVSLRSCIKPLHSTQPDKHSIIVILRSRVMLEFVLHGGLLICNLFKNGPLTSVTADKCTAQRLPELQLPTQTLAPASGESSVVFPSHQTTVLLPGFKNISNVVMKQVCHLI